MKTRHILLFALSFAATAAQAQMSIKISTGQTFRKDTIDHKVLTVQYEMDALTDLSKPDARMQETLRLDIGRQASRFYSYTAFVADSVLSADLANGASSELIAQHANQYHSQWSEQTFKNYPAGRVTTLDELAGDISRLRCEEPAEKPRWTLTQDTLTLLGYRCTRATTQFKGRQWSAWYTPDIPVSEGPWKLCGLPGLILKAEDDEGHYRFTADGLARSHGTGKISPPILSALSRTESSSAARTTSPSIASSTPRCTSASPPTPWASSPASCPTRRLPSRTSTATRPRTPRTHPTIPSNVKGGHPSAHVQGSIRSKALNFQFKGSKLTV